MFMDQGPAKLGIGLPTGATARTAHAQDSCLLRISIKGTGYSSAVMGCLRHIRNGVEMVQDDLIQSIDFEIVAMHGLANFVYGRSEVGCGKTMMYGVRNPYVQSR